MRIAYDACGCTIMAIRNLGLEHSFLTFSAPNKRRTKFAQLGGYDILVKCLDCGSIAVQEKAVHDIERGSDHKSERLAILRRNPDIRLKLQMLVRNTDYSAKWARETASKLLEEL